jgi:hypothetical protein
MLCVQTGSGAHTVSCTIGTGCPIITTTTTIIIIIIIIIMSVVPLGT